MAYALPTVALLVYPDRGGSTEAMAVVNEVDDLMEELTTAAAAGEL